MSTTIRLGRSLLNEAIRDLRRPHVFAAERVGFLFGRTGKLTDTTTLVLMSDYVSLSDDCYDDDPTVGARINAKAIRAAMQRVLTSHECCFHVHAHFMRGPLGFGKTDAKELPRLIPSFAVVAPMSVHGAFLIGPDACVAWVLSPQQKALRPAGKILIVGYPTQICEGNDR